MKLCKKSIGMKEVILIIKLFQKNKNTQSLNQFLNIKDIKGNYLYTLDEQVISFIKVNPMNIELLSDKELETKMDFASIEFSNEQFPYKIIVIPRAVDISDYIREQEELRNKLTNDVCIEIINNRIISTTEMIENKNIIENEFYIMIFDANKDNIEIELNKRANNWISRLKNCGLKSEILEERDIILLVKSFTIPEFARTEGTDYRDNIVQIKRKGV